MDFTTESTGNGNLILVEDPGTNLVTGDTFSATIFAVDEELEDEWEVSNCTYIAAGEFSRDTVVSSGANGDFVVFTGGVKTVAVGLPPEKDIRNSTNVNMTNNALSLTSLNATTVNAVTVNTTNVVANDVTVGSSVVNTIAVATTLVTTGAGQYINSTAIKAPNTGLITATSAAGNGYTYLTGGILMQWGTVDANSSVGDITFPIPFPTAVFSQQATSASAMEGNQVSITAVSTTTMNVRSLSLASASYTSWLVIGK